MLKEINESELNDHEVDVDYFELEDFSGSAGSVKRNIEQVKSNPDKLSLKQRLTLSGMVFLIMFTMGKKALAEESPEAIQSLIHEAQNKARSLIIDISKLEPPPIESGHDGDPDETNKEEKAENKVDTYEPGVVEKTSDGYNKLELNIDGSCLTFLAQIGDDDKLDIQPNPTATYQHLQNFNQFLDAYVADEEMKKEIKSALSTGPGFEYQKAIADLVKHLADTRGLNDDIREKIVELDNDKALEQFSLEIKKLAGDTEKKAITLKHVAKDVVSEYQYKVMRFNDSSKNGKYDSWKNAINSFNQAESNINNYIEYLDKLQQAYEDADAFVSEENEKRQADDPDSQEFKYIKLVDIETERKLTNELLEELKQERQRVVSNKPQP